MEPGGVTVGVRIPFRTQMRQAAVDLLTDYNATLDEPRRLQVYRARPRSLYPPTAFVDRISERRDLRGLIGHERRPTVDVVVLHGIFDSADAVDQGDEFIDGFLGYVADLYHAAGPNTLIDGVSTEDDPNYVPDWLPVEKQQSYYATVISLEGLALD